MSATPLTPATVNARDSFFRAQSNSKNEPTAKPANANAAHGKMGNSQGCGLSKVWTPLMVDWSHQTSECGRQLVHKGGVSKAIAAAQMMAVKIVFRLSCVASVAPPTAAMRHAT